MCLVQQLVQSTANRSHSTIFNLKFSRPSFTVSMPPPPMLLLRLPNKRFQRKPSSARGPGPHANPQEAGEDHPRPQTGITPLAGLTMVTSEAPTPLNCRIGQEGETKARHPRGLISARGVQRQSLDAPLQLSTARFCLGWERPPITGSEMKHRFAPIPTWSVGCRSS